MNMEFISVNNKHSISSKEEMGERFSFLELEMLQFSDLFSILRKAVTPTPGCLHDYIRS